ncbi:Secreted protein OS=Streptomyces alboniger OX=132473 GN=CP975_01505 PE=4 SV=1 [Streptomyces alboniger]
MDGLPGSDRTASYWGREVRVPLTATVRDTLDLKRVKTLELTPRSRSGKAWLMDAWGWRPGTPAVRPAALPRWTWAG